MNLNDYGSCVVLTLLPNDLPNKVEGGQHVTLLYFGNALHPQNYSELLDVIADTVSEYTVLEPLTVEGIEYFGPDGEAVVVTLDPSEESEAVKLRKDILERLTDNLMSIFKEAETYPSYKPHLTLGYLNEGFELGDLELPENLYIDSIAVWNGEKRVSFKIANNLEHYGILRKSGRYPWGSGANPHQRSRSFMGMYEDLKKQGLSETEIAKGLGLNTRELRAHKTIAKGIQRKADEALAFKLKEKNLSNVAIGARMGINESSVRSLLDPTNKLRRTRLENTVEMLKEEMVDGSYLDIGEGSEHHLNMGISRTTFKTAITMLEDEGYKVQYLKAPQMNNLGNDTSVLVLTDENTTWSELNKNQDKIKVIGTHTKDGGQTYTKPKPPQSVDSKRVSVRYGPDGGADKDGIIELRPGVEDLSLGKSRYAQVRIGVDGTHYLKGVAVYSDNMPDGADIIFNTNKKNTGNKLDAMKGMADDPENPWGAVIKANGQRGALNVLNEEGDWYGWSRTLSSQMLSKQSNELAKRQLDLTYDIKKAEFDEINSLTNPTIKKHLLEKFADGADSSAVFLKAKGLPGTQNHVILPVTKMKPNEVYAPQYKNGERVVLIRHPHGGIFEIPELTVNNKNRDAKKLIGQGIDAIGINPKVAAQLSGADFDGDTVLVIPNRTSTGIRSSSPLKDLKNFDPQVQYRGDATTKKMKNTQTEMGLISNLITDMTIQGATESELARAVKHSMVVIDAEKHGLNYKQSFVDNGVSDLKKKYQKRDDGRVGGASTLISRASSEARVLDRKPRPASEGGGIDPKTGKKVFVETGKSYVNKDGKTVFNTNKSTKMAETDDAFSLVSKDGGTPIEAIYATHANRLKNLGNQARKEMLATPPLKYSPSAYKAYAPQVESLNRKLTQAQKNAPLERKAQLVGNAILKQKQQANPGMDGDTLKKEKTKAIAEARARTGAGKDRIVITDIEWEAIQAGAISNNKLSNILKNTDLDDVKKLATPRTSTGVPPALLARAKSMMNMGYTQQEIAASLGVGQSTLNAALNE